MLSPGGEAELSDVEIALSTRNPNHFPKYVRKNLSVRLRALRLSASDHDRVPYFIVAITVLGEGSEPLPGSENPWDVLERVLPTAEATSDSEPAAPVSTDVQLALW
jgi:hypothetical protein